MRLVIPAIFVFLTATAGTVCAAGLDDETFNQQSIDALTLQARLAPPREQCFLYAELVHQMTELSLRQYDAGDVDKASDLLKQVQELTHKIHFSVADNRKRLKNTEILLRHTVFRLTGMLHASSYEDRPLVEQTLAQVSHVQTETMMQVFRK